MDNKVLPTPKDNAILLARRLRENGALVVALCRYDYGIEANKC